MGVLHLPGPAVTVAGVRVDGAAFEGGEGELGRHEQRGTRGQGEKAEQGENAERDVHVSSPPS